MSKNDQARISKMLDIVSTFEPYTSCSLSELSVETGIPAEDLRTELLMLREFDIGFGYIDIEIEDDEVRVGQLPPVFSKILQLDNMQMLAFALALHMTGLASDTTLLDKLYQGAEGSWSREFIEKHIFVYPFAHSTQVFKMLAIGLRNSYPVRITYTKDRVETERLIDVARMSLESQGWYVSGYCRKAKEQRIFRLDAITNAEIIYLERSRATDNLEPAESAQDALERAAQNADNATIHFDSRSSFVSQEWPLSSEPAFGEDGSVTIQIPVVNEKWVARQIVSLCGQAKVIEPAWLKASVRDFALQCLSELPQ